MKKKISKFIFLFILPAIALSMVSVLFATNFISSYVRAEDKFGGAFRVVGKSTISIGGETSLSNFSAKDGGAVWVDTNATFNMTDGNITNNIASGDGGAVYNTGTLTMANGDISENTATSNGGGVYNTGTFTMTNGNISNNTASEKGNNIYNSGTFTMNGGTVGTSESTQTGYGIYNTGTMNLLGGTIHDNIYSSASFTTTPSATLGGTITLSDSATITVTNYNGTTPNYTIVLSESRANGTILTFTGNSTAPDLTNLSISGFSTVKSQLTCVQGSSSTEWVVKLIPQQYSLTISKGTSVSKFSVTIDGTTTNYTSQYSNILDYGTSVSLGITSASGYYGGYWYGNDGYTYSQTKTITIKGNTTLSAYAYSNVFYYKYEGNGNTNTSTTMSKSTHYYLDGSTLTENQFKKTGYKFTGWNTSADGTGTSYVDQEKVSSYATSNGTTITLYAQWEIGKYTITFDDGAGSGGPGSITDVKYGDTLSAITSLPQRSKCIFEGYYDTNGTRWFYKTGSATKTTFDIDSDVVLTAKWTNVVETFVRGTDSEGDYVEFGEYPQSLEFIPNSAIISKPMGGGAVEYNGNTYYYDEDTELYYLYEPIKWRIVYENGDDLILISDKILAASVFNTDYGSVGHNMFFTMTDGSIDHTSTLYDVMEDFESCLYNRSGSVDGDRKNFKLDFYYNAVLNLLYYSSNNSFFANTSYTNEFSGFPVVIPSYDDFNNPSYNYNDINGNSIMPDDYADTYSKNMFKYASKTATDYAKAMGADNSWWTMSGRNNGLSNSGDTNNRYAFYVSSEGELITQNNTDNDALVTKKHGVVPMIRINTSKLLSCGHCYDESKTVTKTVPNTDQSSGHHDETTYYCSVCSYSETVISNETTHNSQFSGYDYDESGHYNKYKCVCGYETTSSSGISHSYSYTKTGSTSTHKATCLTCPYWTTQNHSDYETKTTYIYLEDNKSEGHYEKTTRTCGKCGQEVSSVTSSDVVSHEWDSSRTTTTTQTDITGSYYTKTTKYYCKYCNYSYEITKTYPNLFTHSSHDDCGDCSNCTEVTICNQDVLLDDKKKYTSQLMFEEKRYTNDTIQLPKILG